jgi:hypothetical protein
MSNRTGVFRTRKVSKYKEEAGYYTPSTQHTEDFFQIELNYDWEI